MLTEDWDFNNYVSVLYNKVPQTVWPKQQKFIISQLWKLKVQDKAVGRCASF